MRVIHKQKGGGKTYDLIKAADNYDGYIVCISQDECARIAGIAGEMGCKIHFPISFHEFRNREYGPLVNHFLIDNVDEMLRQMTEFPITVISITKSD